MPGSRQSNPPSPPPAPKPPRIDLSEVTEATRRALYDAVVATQFEVPPGTDDSMPFYNADQAGLVVAYVAGRWFACWKALEETDNANLPPDAKHQLVRIYEAPELPYGVKFHDV
jgi:hypothetical protein